MRLGALGKNVDVQRTICQLIGEFEPRGHSHATTLPMIVHDPHNLFLGRRYVLLCCGFWHTFHDTSGSDRVDHDYRSSPQMALE